MVYPFGRLNLNVTPFPSGLFSAQILPPWASTMLFEMNNPNPVPVCDLETNFVKSWGIISTIYACARIFDCCYEFFIIVIILDFFYGDRNGSGFGKLQSIAHKIGKNLRNPSLVCHYKGGFISI